MPLSKSECDRLKPKSKAYKKFDGGGLYLEVSPKGSKIWRLKYYFQGKESRISFGKYPLITLHEAREKRDEVKKLIADGINPSHHRETQKRLELVKAQNTFEAIAREWHEKQKSRWSERWAKIVIQRLEKNIFPYLGSWAISDIKPVDLLQPLQIIERRDALEIASSVRKICGQIFRYAIQTGRCEVNPAPTLIGAIQTRPTKHFASLDVKDLPEFLEALRNSQDILRPQTQNAIWFSLLNFTRPKEVCHARWQDIDFETKQWFIPAEFMKSKKSHIVPFSTQTIQILHAQRTITEQKNSEWVFPSMKDPKKPMNAPTVNIAIKELGFDGRMTAHGFRALARTAIREKLGYYPDVIEAQLAHKPLGALGAAYDRAQFLDERAKMMQDWADYVDELI